jgi:DeoR family transcriptional regulator of aga operon
MKIIEEEKNVSVKVLSKKLKVSEVTIRKDLERLEQNNLVTRTHGGATIEDILTEDRSIYSRMKLNRNLKEKIGRKAVSFLSENEVIAMDGGTTTLFVAKNLPIEIEQVVITDSAFCAIELSKKPNIEVILLGGLFHKKSFSVGGSITEELIRNLRFNKAIISAGGIIPEIGLFDNLASEPYVKRQMTRVADEVFVVADSTKLGKRLFFNFLATGEINKLFTDSGIKKEDIDILTGLGVEVIIC